MLHVVCVNAANYQGRGADYVNKLFDMVTRNLPGGMEGRFTCFTDDAGKNPAPLPLGYHPDIDIQPLPRAGLNGWWNKLALFGAGVFPSGDRILFLDLDTLITGPLDEIVAYNGDFAILEDFYRPGGYCSAVMMWPAGFGHHIWNSYLHAGRPEIEGGDQAWIEKQVDNADIIQNLFPGSVVSYKASGGIPPEKASIVCFHGRPRPHEVKGWASEVWKVGGLTRAQLDTVCNTAKETLLANVRKSLIWGEPQLEAAALHDGHAVIIGGGPSINSRVDEIRMRVGLGQTVFALNGAMRWCRDRGIPVGYQVIVDAKPVSFNFLLDEPDELTTHLIASQCDPSLFVHLVGKNAFVNVWHSDAPGVEEILPEGTLRIGGGSTVGLAAMSIAAVLGFKYIHLYGYDSSVSKYDNQLGEEHHAYYQPQNEDDLIVDVMLEDGTQFRSAAWMVQQAQEFPRLCGELMEMGVEVITVAGEGLLPYIARGMDGSAPTAADIRASALLQRLPADRAVFGAEIGVFGGDMAKRLLQRQDLNLLMVDSWRGDGVDMLNKQDYHAQLSQKQQDDYFALTMREVGFAGGRAVVLRMSSQEALEEVQDGLLDFVFVDADHAYKSCLHDLWGWWTKLRPGGLMSGHDYGNELPGFGVTKAVDEFVQATGLELELGGNCTFFIRKPEVAEGPVVAREAAE